MNRNDDITKWRDKNKKLSAAVFATIPDYLSHCVVDYADAEIKKSLLHNKEKHPSPFAPLESRISRWILSTPEQVEQARKDRFIEMRNYLWKIVDRHNGSCWDFDFDARLKAVIEWAELPEYYSNVYGYMGDKLTDESQKKWLTLCSDVTKEAIESYGRTEAQRVAFSRQCLIEKDKRARSWALHGAWRKKGIE